jgi:very-short-patch-repair endonuclease
MHPADARIGEIAGAQDNVIELVQLLEAGLGRKALQGRLRSGAMQRIHQGVFLVGPAPPTFAALARAAALAVGPGAVVGFGPATALRKLRPEPAEARSIDIIVPGRNPGRRPGIVVHRSTIVPVEFGYIRGIPVTSAARTICDLAAREPLHEIEQLLIDARRARCVRDAELHAVLDRVPHRLKFVVEVDGRKDHGTPWAFENDRLRDQILAAAGHRVIRITWRQLVQEPMAVAVRIAQALVWAQQAA